MRFVKLLVAAALLFGCQKPVSESRSTQASLQYKATPVLAPTKGIDSISESKARSTKKEKSTPAQNSASIDSQQKFTKGQEAAPPPSSTLAVASSSSLSPSAKELEETHTEVPVAVPHVSFSSLSDKTAATERVVEDDSSSSFLGSSSADLVETHALSSASASSLAVAISSSESINIISQVAAAEPEPSSAVATSIAAESSVQFSSIASESAPVINPPPAVTLTGWMNIDFLSRDKLRKGELAVDTYRMDLTAAGALRAHGVITRKPRVVTAILGREKSPLEMIFDVNFELIHPERNDRLDAGKLSGTVSLSQDGIYKLSGGKGALSISSKVASEKGGLGGVFAGSIKGKPEESTGLLREYTRWIGGRKVSYRAQHTDPLEFRNLFLAAGPIELYPEASVTGRLDYDYDTGNWLTDGIFMRYRSGTDILSDKITGSIKWEEDPDRAKNGRGKYVFNLRFNEAKPQKAQDEADFFASVSDEEAFFVVDESVPTLSGTVSYRDKVNGTAESGELTVLESRISYDLTGKGLTKQQLINFFKLWLLLSGPANDE